MPELKRGGWSVRQRAFTGGIVGAIVATLMAASSAAAGAASLPPLPIAKPGIEIPLPAPRPQPIDGAARAAAEFIAAATTHGRQPEDADTVRKVVAVGKGDTLMNVLVDSGAGRSEAHEAISALSEVFNPRRLKAGQEITLVFRQAVDDQGPELVSVSLSPSIERDVLARREVDGTFAPVERTREFERGLVRLDGEIESSLYIAATRAKLPAAVLIELIRILSFDVDFQRDIRPGDRFDVVIRSRSRYEFMKLPQRQ